MENKQVKESKFILGIMLASIIVSLPLFFKGIDVSFGQDAAFHLNRIEGLFLEMRNGSFPIKMESYWMDGYGYPVSIYYGDLFLYIPALLRLIGIPVVASYKIYVYIINLGTLLCGYIAFEKISNNNKIALIATICYCFSYYRLVNVYIRGAVGEYTAMMFLPIVVLGIYKIYFCEHKAMKGACKDATILAIGISAIVGSHMLSCEMVGIVLFVFAVVSYKRTFTKNVFITLLIAGVEVLLLNAYYIVSFCDYYCTQTVNINNTMSNSREIQSAGASILKLLSFFEIPFGNTDWKSQIGLNIGVVLTITVVLFFFKIILGDKKRGDILLWSGTFLLLFMSTNVFPWDYIRGIPLIGNILAQIQFPWRYLGLASLFATILLIKLLEELSCIKTLRIVSIIIIVISVFMMVYFTNDYYKYSQRRNYKDTTDLDSYDMGFIEYLRVGTDRSLFDGQVVCDKGIYIKNIEKKGNEIVIDIECEKQGKVSFPKVNYKGYKVYDDTHELKIYDGVNNLVSVNVEKNYNGKLRLEYKQMWYWIVAEWVSFLSLVVVLVIMIGEKRGGERK